MTAGNSRATKIISIGGGWVANTRHIPSLKHSGLYEVIGAISNNAGRAKATQEKHQLAHADTVINFTSGWQAEAEAVMIGTIPHVHAEIATQALNAGKHVLTEKPMTVEQEDAKKLEALAREKNLTLAVVHNFQYARASQRVRHMLASGELGEVKAIYGVQLCNHERNIPDWCDQLPLGLFYDEAPHFYYLFRWLAGGDITLLDASVWESKAPGRNTPRMVSAEYASHADVPVYLHINFESSITEWHVTIVAEKATVDIDVWRDILVTLPNDGAHSAKDIMMTSVKGSYQHWLGVLTGGFRYIRGTHLYGNVEIVTRFHRAMHGEDSLQGMNPAEGQKVIGLMHEVVEKAARH
ncbi:MAG: Gfo/Idh/MocA family oxidoreductase [Spartobacteria bacterium]|nr:Gfo/Idh/MocA family oxidoreductase [Spartobacteria bacterium]